MTNISRWSQRGVYTPDKRMMGISNEQLDAYLEAQKVEAIRKYQDTRLVIELNSIGRHEVPECNCNGVDHCSHNPPMPASVEEELPY